MPKQSYYGDPYNQGDDFNWTTKFGKKPKTEGDKLREEGVGEDGGFIDDGTLDAEGNVQAISMEDIQSDIVKQKQLRDAQRNKEYDQKMREIEASGVTGRAKAAALKEANRLRTGDTGINPADIPDNALQAFNSLATAVAEDPLTAAEELIEMKRSFDVGSTVGRSTGHPGAGIAAGVAWYAGEQLVDFLDVALRRRAYATAGGPALPVGKTSYDQIIAQGGAILRSATRNIDNTSGGTSAHMKSKVKLHERALDDEMLHWDTKAVERRSKIDEQFQLDKSGKPEGPHKIRGGSTETERRAKAAWSLGEEVTPADIKIFEESNQSVLDGYNWHLHGSDIKVGKTEGHHKGVVRQIFDASNGLNRKYRLKSAKYMEKRIGFELGYHGRNVEPVPIRFHPRVHAIINSRISSSPDRFNVEGIAQRLGFPKNWQSVLTYEERLPLYNAVSDAIRESVDAINTSWKVLLSRSDDLTTYSKEEYLDLMLQHKKLDDKLRQMSSPSFMAQSSRTGWDIKDTSTTVLNEILDKSNRSDLRLPYIGKVEPNMAPEIRKVINQENGWQLLKEVLLTNQSAATVMKAYPKVKLTVKQRKSLDTYARTLRSRGKSHKFIDELGMRPDD